VARPRRRCCFSEMLIESENIKNATSRSHKFKTVNRSRKFKTVKT